MVLVTVVIVGRNIEVEAGLGMVVVKMVIERKGAKESRDGEEGRTEKRKNNSGSLNTSSFFSLPFPQRHLSRSLSC